MWIATRIGWFSIVVPGPEYKKHERDGKLLVRARVRKHLEKMIERMLPLKVEIEATPQRDYQYRTLVPGAAVQAFLSDEIAAINYTNFKSAVRAVDRDFEGCCHAVWGVVNSHYSYGAVQRRVATEK